MTFLLSVVLSAEVAWAERPSPSPLPTPVPTTVPTTVPTSVPMPMPGESDDGSGGPAGWMADGISEAITTFFRGAVTGALNPLLNLLGQTLLTTPPPQSVPQIGELWNRSRGFAIAAYVLLVLIAGVVLMAYETVQTRHSVKEIAPRVVVGFLAANLSLVLATKAIAFANALSRALLGEGVNPDLAAQALHGVVAASLASGGIFFFVLAGALAVMLTAILIVYIVRVALTVILLAAAPLALMCHALPQTEALAFWWWRAFAAVLAIQVGQSLTLVAALKLFFAPGGMNAFGLPTGNGLVNLLVCLALFYLLLKMPFWILSQARLTQGHSFVGGLVKGFVAYKTFGLIRGAGRTGAATSARSTVNGRSPAGKPTDPYAHVQMEPNGQYVLPLKGLHRGRRPAAAPAADTAPAAPTPSAPHRFTARQVQLPLPFDDDLWGVGQRRLRKPPKGRQLRLPLDTPRFRTPARTTPRPPEAPPPTTGSPRSRPRKRWVQDQLPLGVSRTPAPARHQQLWLPLDLRKPAKPGRGPRPPRRKGDAP